MRSTKGLPLQNILLLRNDAVIPPQVGPLFAARRNTPVTAQEAGRANPITAWPPCVQGTEVPLCLAYRHGPKPEKRMEPYVPFFPAMLMAWSGPFFDVRLCSTDGVSLQNAARVSGPAQLGLRGRLVADALCRHGARRLGADYPIGSGYAGAASTVRGLCPRVLGEAVCWSRVQVRERRYARCLLHP